mmetsp:Transcript_13901/g.37297  ORF Transcript_13901/g.37297 Transcript_13901/m.37297 type:complete len:588 (-) Transcript_13901:692-2455(-)
MRPIRHAWKSAPCVLKATRAWLSGGTRWRSSWAGRSRLPKISNEPFLHYAPGSPEKVELREALAVLRKQDPPVIRCIVDGQEVSTGGAHNFQRQPLPHDHAKSLCEFAPLDAAIVESAIAGALKAKKAWAALSQDDRNAVFLKAADLAAGPYRQEINAAVMLGQGKTIWQAEIDGAVETIDFWRFAARWAESIHDMQPPENSPGVWNRMEFRPLEGFVAAISPFNFLAIGANLPSSAVIMGNVALWKPAENAMYGSYLIYKILQEAGLPDGVIQFLPGDGKTFADVVLNSRDFAGLHFTGSTAVFNELWQTIGRNLGKYRTYPRIVGETGGKNFHLVHESADVEHVVFSTLRGAFEYQGQKCSATSRMYVPASMWASAVKPLLLRQLETVKLGAPDDVSSFVSAVINERAFNRIRDYIARAESSGAAKVIAGGFCDKSKGYFVEPTVIETTDPKYETMEHEIFGPVLTVYPYPDEMPWAEVIALVDGTSNYALTGAVFARDRAAIASALDGLRDAAGNFYINDKSTGSIVGQQPFGGSRMSGTNDKSGSTNNLLRWVSPRAVKELFVPLRTYRYPSMLRDIREEENV